MTQLLLFLIPAGYAALVGGLEYSENIAKILPNIAPKLFSVSVRDVAVDTIPVYEQFADFRNPFDFEIAAGWKAESKGLRGKGSVETWTWYERENFAYYTGFDAKTKVSTKFIENSAFFENRQAKNMLRGGISSKLIFLKYGRIGASTIWDHYDPAACLDLGVESATASAGLTVYRKGVESFEVRLGKSYKASKWLEIEPMLKYGLDRQRNDDFQAKIIFRRKKGK